MRIHPTVIALSIVMILVPPCALELKLNRNYGTSFGDRIKGKFSAKAKDVTGATRVEFFLNGELVATDAEEPFAWSFTTTDYPPGNYTIRAVAYLATGGQEEDDLTVEFVETFGKSWNLFLWGMMMLIAGVVVFSLWVTQRERKRPPGKTRCPQCGTVFDRRWSPMHKGAAYRNTCPMCGRSFWADMIVEGEGSDGTRVF